MDILKMLSDLYAERSHLEGAITTLERLASGQPKRRGRPPKWLSQARELSGLFRRCQRSEWSVPKRGSEWRRRNEKGGSRKEGQSSNPREIARWSSTSVRTAVGSGVYADVFSEGDFGNREWTGDESV
jgi:hypothetical protein